ncbi:hypothetical protein ACQP2F_40720 [Actinoplanes sp. CA-030573]|uniref:hypothetical protein n=1 Tax=Actinoplanes sp. CA-030573 TaxID=3239898 RepID=UPI003D911ECD
MTRAAPTPEQMQWALSEASHEALAVAPGWFRAWPTADERWSAVNIRGATQVIVNHSREDDRHPNSWTVRALFGTHAVELHVGPYDNKVDAVLVAHAVLNIAFRDTSQPSQPPPVTASPVPPAPPAPEWVPPAPALE